MEVYSELPSKAMGCQVSRPDPASDGFGRDFQDVGGFPEGQEFRHAVRCGIRSSTLRNESGNLMYIILAKRMTSGDVLK
jgi:hypothetical protein